MAVDAPATPEQKTRLAKLSKQEVSFTELAGEPIVARVAYVLGADGGGRGGLEILGLGIHFHAMTPSSAEMLLQFLEARSQ